MLKIKCPKCGTPLEVPEDKAQGKGRCSSCGTKFLIPANEDDEIEIIEENQGVVERSKKGNDSKEKSESDKEVEKNEGQSSEDQEQQLSDDSMTKWLKALGFISLGLLIGIVLGFYVGRYTAPPEDEFYQSGPSIKSRGDTIDPFGIDNN